MVKPKYDFSGYTMEALRERFRALNFAIAAAILADETHSMTYQNLIVERDCIIAEMHARDDDSEDTDNIPGK